MAQLRTTLPPCQPLAAAQSVVTSMPFQPAIDEQLVIDGISYQVCAHPAIPGRPFVQEGQSSRVVQLRTAGVCCAQSANPALRAVVDSTRAAIADRKQYSRLASSAPHDYHCRKPTGFGDNAARTRLCHPDAVGVWPAMARIDPSPPPAQPQPKSGASASANQSAR